MNGQFLSFVEMRVIEARKILYYSFQEFLCTCGALPQAICKLSSVLVIQYLSNLMQTLNPFFKHRNWNSIVTQQIGIQLALGDVPIDLGFG